MTLSPDDMRLVDTCLHAVANGPFIPDWEFSILMGLTRAECAAIAARWPNVDLADNDVRRAVMNSLNHLTGYPIDHEDQWDRYVPASREAIHALRDRASAALFPPE